ERLAKWDASTTASPYGACRPSWSSRTGGSWSSTEEERDAAEHRLAVPPTSQPRLSIHLRSWEVDGTILLAGGRLAGTRFTRTVPPRGRASVGGSWAEGAGSGRRGTRRLGTLLGGSGIERPLVDLAPDGPLQGGQGLAQLGLDLGDLDRDLKHLPLGREDRRDIGGRVLVPGLGQVERLPGARQDAV